MTNTEHMELARLCSAWRALESVYEAGLGQSANKASIADGKRMVVRRCRRELEAILNAATITPDPKEEPPDI